MKFKDILKGPAASRDAEQGYTSFKFKIYEFISAIFVKILIYTPVTPNQVTILSALFPMLGAFFFGFGVFWFSLAGIACLYLGELMDAIDGTLARCTKKCSKLQSNILANLYHSSSYPFLFLGIGYGVFVQTSNANYLLLGALAAVFQMATAFLRFLKNTIILKNPEFFKQKKKLLYESKEEGLFSVDKGLKGFILSAFEAPMKHLRMVIVITVILNYFFTFGWLRLFVVFYGVFTPIKAVGFTYTIYRSFKRIELKK